AEVSPLGHRDPVVGAAHQGQDRGGEPVREFGGAGVLVGAGAAGRAVEADRPGQAGVVGGGNNRAPPAHAETQGEHRLAAAAGRVAQPGDGGAQVALAAGSGEVGGVFHEREVVAAFVGAGGAAVVVDGDRGVPLVGEPDREVPVERGQAAEVGQHGYASAGRGVGSGRARGQGGAVGGGRGQGEALADRGDRAAGDREGGVRAGAHAAGHRRQLARAAAKVDHQASFVKIDLSC